jgi:hypothetical protein
MKTVLAQGRKDLASQAVLLWVWGLCVGVDCLCFLTRIPLHFALNGRGPIFLLGAIVGGMTMPLVAFVTQALLGFVLLVRIVQNDLLTDSSAFWRTRPITRYELLAEKALFAALLLAGGALAASALAADSPPASNGAALLGALVFVAGVFVFAAVTSDFSKFIVAFLALAWGGMIVGAIFMAIIKNLTVPAGSVATSWPSAAPSLLAGAEGHRVISVFYLLAFVAIAAFQYLTLRTKVARALLFATFLLATILQGGGGIQVHHTTRLHVRGP